MTYEALLHRLPSPEALSAANREFTNRYDLPPPAQPVHTVYGGGNLFNRALPAKLGGLALKCLAEYFPNSKHLAVALGFDKLGDEFAERLYAAVKHKLETEPIEESRIDFEDGYGYRPDDEEDKDAANAAVELAEAVKAGTCPRYIGIRVKSLTEANRPRAIRTLCIFLGKFAEQGVALPESFVITVPKVQHPEQIAYIVHVLEELETALSFDTGTLKLDLMVETPTALFLDGKMILHEFIKAGKGRIVAMAYGTYDDTALLAISAHEQCHTHPEADFARSTMKRALAGTGIRISDGATTVMPIGPHKAPKGGELTPDQADENQRVVWANMRLHFENVLHSLKRGIFQGWDLNPNQLIARYAAVYHFFYLAQKANAERLKRFLENAAKATLTGGHFDDNATGQGLLNFFLSAINCGAFTEEQVTEMTGITIEELRTRSFKEINDRRRAEA